MAPKISPYQPSVLIPAVIQCLSKPGPLLKVILTPATLRREISPSHYKTYPGFYKDIWFPNRPLNTSCRVSVELEELSLLQEGDSLKVILWLLAEAGPEKVFYIPGQASLLLADHSNGYRILFPR